MANCNCDVKKPNQKNINNANTISRNKIKNAKNKHSPSWLLAPMHRRVRKWRTVSKQCGTTHLPLRRTVNSSFRRYRRRKETERPERKGTRGYLVLLLSLEDRGRYLPTRLPVPNVLVVKAEKAFTLLSRTTNTVAVEVRKVDKHVEQARVLRK